MQVGVPLFSPVHCHRPVFRALPALELEDQVCAREPFLSWAWSRSFQVWGYGMLRERARFCLPILGYRHKAVQCNCSHACSTPAFRLSTVVPAPQVLQPSGLEAHATNRRAV